MYEVFDNFLSTDTWYKAHPSDERRFYGALAAVVWSDQFNPDQMRRYMRDKKNIPADDHKSKFAKTIDQLNCATMLGRSEIS